MVFARKFSKLVFGVFLSIASLHAFPQNADAMLGGIDLLGEAAEPLIAPTQEKLKSLLVYIWLQPYGGYAWGKSDQTRVSTGGGVTSAYGLKTEGFLYGGRGGIMLIHTLKIGLDYSVQTMKRNTLVETTTGTYVQKPIKGNNSMFGMIIGFDVPYTPLQGFVTRYFKGNAKGDSLTNGEGWGGGLSLVIKNPILLSAEMRKLNYSSAVSPTGRRAEGSIEEYYVNLALMLF